MVKGVLDDIIFSRDAKLDLLHYNSVMRLNKDFLKPIMQHMTKDNIELLNLVAKANSCIDIDLMNKHFSKPQSADEYIIKPLYRIAFSRGNKA